MSLGSSSAVQEALKNLTGTLDENVTNGNGFHGPTTPSTTSFSIALFSTSPGNSSELPFFYQYHHTASTLQNSTNGVQKFNANSVYRIGTLTQVFTVWAFLIEAGDSYWYNSVTRYVPELAQAARALNAQQNPIEYEDWDDVTVGDLASHMAGMGRDYGVTDLSNRNFPFASYGFPPLNSTNKVPSVPERLCS
ncbi:hypothetical protein MMC14_009113 [Varicellaria rhodocarpa]|nr:hypothetical protein [Varicellaria rhodocarpa]